MNGYVPRHARGTDPADLPPILRGLADKIEIVPSKDDSK
jgi:hypothetical protein